MKTPIGTVRAMYFHCLPMGGRRVYVRKIGPYKVRTFVDFMGRATGTIWIKE
ncbi:MAG TPA: hypothetical protein VIY48_07245 [Candidatus Paceibacterota bacterium]